MRGGKRKGAGRPETEYETKMVRVPLPCLDAVKEIIRKFKKRIKNESQ